MCTGCIFKMGRGEGVFQKAKSVHIVWLWLMDTLAVLTYRHMVMYGNQAKAVRHITCFTHTQPSYSTSNSHGHYAV